MLDFEVQRCTRRCEKTGRELRPGEPFYSFLIFEGARVVRYDYSSEGWEGPPENAVGWWKSQMPDPNARKLYWAPNDVMMHYFEQLEDKEDKQDTRYVLALLMLRRRIVKLEEAKVDDEGNEKFLLIYCPRKETQYQVAVMEPGQQRIDEIQEELARLLFASAA